METKMKTQIQFTVIQTLKGIAIALPILFLLMTGYINIMTKLTSLEERIVYGQQNYINLTKKIDNLQDADKAIQKDLINHIIETDDTKVKQPKIK